MSDSQPAPVSEPSPKALAYAVPWPLRALYVALLGVMLAGFLVRRDRAFWNGLPLVGGLEIGDHISNLAIIFMLHAGSGLVGITSGAPFKRLAWVGLGLLGINFVVEAFSCPLNVADWTDALYGALGIALSTSLLWLMDRAKVLQAPSSRI